jgi:hypothetical protein
LVCDFVQDYSLYGIDHGTGCQSCLPKQIVAQKKDKTEASFCVVRRVYCSVNFNCKWPAGPRSCHFAAGFHGQLLRQICFH